MLTGRLIIDRKTHNVSAKVDARREMREPDRTLPYVN